MDPTREIVVPEFIVDAVMKDDLVVAVCNGKAVSLTRLCVMEIARRICTAIAEDPIVPSESQSQNLAVASRTNAAKSEVAEVAAVVWQTIMFLAPEPEMLPSDIIDLIHGKNEWGPSDVLEAYRRGQRSKETL